MKNQKVVCRKCNRQNWVEPDARLRATKKNPVATCCTRRINGFVCGGSFIRANKPE